jgi:hypothetical protein
MRLFAPAIGLQDTFCRHLINVLAADDVATYFITIGKRTSNAVSLALFN